ncbi:MAG: SDR family oxidoreductase [Alphaproteobacteria bacterium]|nr:SDR family oxidoreductase [Alphaproteobacteria bacterium]
MVNELAGKVALVTGSARNLGRATAEELARAGAAVIVNARQAKALAEEVADGIVKAGGRAMPVVADITDVDAVQRMVDAAVAEFGGIDILVNNAANRSASNFAALDRATWDNAMGAALNGAFNISRACVPLMAQRGGGAVVSMGGLTSYSGAANRTHQMTAKAGLQAMTRGIAIDMGPQNIRANFVIVGVFETERAGSSSVRHTMHDAIHIPLGRKGTPQDTADLIRFLVGPGATYISGQTIHVNGAAYSTP